VFLLTACWSDRTRSEFYTNDFNLPRDQYLLLQTNLWNWVRGREAQ
jgi:hypothetical protein